MEEEFAVALSKKLRGEFPDIPVMERYAVYKQGGPKAGQITWNVEYPESGSANRKIIGVTLDVDVWAKGPDSSDATAIAGRVEQLLVDWYVNTENQGTVRLIGFSRATMLEEVEKMAHITMRFTGRAFRRL